MSRRSTLPVLVAFLVGVASTSARAGFVITDGVLKVTPKVNVTVPFDAKFTGVQAAIAGMTTGNKDDLVPVPAQPMADVILTVRGGPLAGTYNAARYGPIPKFVGKPLTGISQTGLMDVKQGGTEASSTTGLLSAATPDGLFINYNADLKGRAEVKNPGAAMSDRAFASSEDPWLFTPSTSAELKLSVSLQNVSITSSPDTNQSAVGQIEAFGSFGFDSAAGFQTLASWDFLKEVPGSGSFSLSSMTLIDQVSSKPLMDETFNLSPGLTYRLSATLQAGAQIEPAPAPEPSAVTLLGSGAISLFAYAWRRMSKGRKEDGEKE
jgi:hypothetical protein